MDKYSGLKEILDESKIKYNESMKKHNTMKVGGNADVLVIPSSIDEIIGVLKYAKSNSIKCYIIGNGSNLLVRDEGIRGIVLKINSKFSDYEVLGEKITACSGCTMPGISQIAKKNNLTGFEFACGIPGTIGGGVRMNAGAYGSQVEDIIEEVTYLNEDLNICTIKKEDMKLSYRHSIFCEQRKWIILSATFKLKYGNIDEIIRKMNENKEARITKQPLDLPNFGSVFKRPEGYFVGKLVSDAGLRGVTVGGAQVSQKHTGFMVNISNATCNDVINLIKLVQDTVYEKFGVKLQTEVEIIGGEN